jgi:hypothetical protein
VATIQVAADVSRFKRERYEGGRGQECLRSMRSSFDQGAAYRERILRAAYYSRRRRRASREAINKPSGNDSATNPRAVSELTVRSCSDGPFFK